MKNFWILPAFFVVTLISCINSKKEKEDSLSPVAGEEIAYNSYGERIGEDDNLSAAQMWERFEALEVGDTLETGFKTTITSVCKNKGCWMTLDLPENEEDVMVKFKDYGFFVPKDVEQKEVIVHGKAYVTEVSVEEQRHYAEDKGHTEEEIAAITEPKKTFSFLADGVLIKE